MPKLIDRLRHFLGGYFTYFQLLILALFLYLLVYLMLTYVPPASVAHWFWPDSYFPFQLLLGSANFFFFTFLFQNKRLGLWLTLTFFVILFFKLTHFVFTFPLIIAVLTTTSLLFWWLVLVKRPPPSS